MKKSFGIFIATLFISLLAFSLTSCKDDVEKVAPEMNVISISLDSPFIDLDGQPKLKDGSETEYEFYVTPETTNENLKTLAPKFELSEGCIINPGSGVAQDFSAGAVTYTITHPSTKLTKVFTLTAERNKYEDAKILSVEIFFNNIIEDPVVPAEGTNIKFLVSAETESNELTALVPYIEISAGATIFPESGVAQDFSEGSVEYTVTSESKNKSIYTLTCVREKFASAVMLDIEIGLNEESVLEEDLDLIGENIGENIKYLVAPDVDLTAIAFLIDISDGATIKPESGDAVDLSNGPVEYTITSEDGEHTSKYTVSITKAKSIIYNFEPWFERGSGKAKRWDPGMGSGKVDEDIHNTLNSTNNGVAQLNSGFMNLGVDFTVFPVYSPDGYNETSARITTVKTPGGEKIGNKIPIVMSGSLFTGRFQVSMVDNLLSTKFGYPVFPTIGDPAAAADVINGFQGIPLRVRGVSKYTPGAEYLRCYNIDNRHLMQDDGMKVDPATIDQWVITVVLYEYVDVKEVLTGLDLHTSDKIVAIGVLEGGEITKYTPFYVDLEYKKKHDSEKTYKVAVVLSSSKEGDKFSGAPGSTLFVDDLELIYKDKPIVD